MGAIVILTVENFATGHQAPGQRPIDESAKRPGPVKLSVYVWFNDEHPLPKTGSRTGVYEAFRRLLLRGEVPVSSNEPRVEIQNA